LRELRVGGFWGWERVGDETPSRRPNGRAASADALGGLAGSSIIIEISTETILAVVVIHVEGGEEVGCTAFQGIFEVGERVGERFVFHPSEVVVDIVGMRHAETPGLVDYIVAQQLKLLKHTKEILSILKVVH
jgi:hypothetical protein